MVILLLSLEYWQYSASWDWILTKDHQQQHLLNDAMPKSVLAYKNSSLLELNDSVDGHALSIS